MQWYVVRFSLFSPFFLVFVLLGIIPTCGRPCKSKVGYPILGWVTIFTSNGRALKHCGSSFWSELCDENCENNNGFQSEPITFYRSLISNTYVGSHTSTLSYLHENGYPS